MTGYVARRVALAALVVAGVIIATFVIARVVPGDPAATWAGPHASAAQVAAARRFLGLDRPALVQERLELGAGYQITPRVNIYTDIQNLLSEHYFEAFGYPALPLTFRSGIKLNFGGESWSLK